MLELVLMEDIEALCFSSESEADFMEALGELLIGSAAPDFIQDGLDGFLYSIQGNYDWDQEREEYYEALCEFLVGSPYD